MQATGSGFIIKLRAIDGTYSARTTCKPTKVLCLHKNPAICDYSLATTTTIATILRKSSRDHI